MTIVTMDQFLGNPSMIKNTNNNEETEKVQRLHTTSTTSSMDNRNDIDGQEQQISSIEIDCNHYYATNKLAPVVYPNLCRTISNS